MDWKSDLEKLCEFDEVAVVHNPMSPRYWRAQTELNFILSNASVVGWYQIPDVDASKLDSSVDRIFHLVTWCESRDESTGFYSVFRLGYDLIGSEVIPSYAELFCFYDGKDPLGDDPNNPLIRSLEEAKSYMKLNFPEYEEYGE